MAYLAERGFPVPAVWPGTAAGELVMQRLSGMTMVEALVNGAITAERAGGRRHPDQRPGDRPGQRRCRALQRRQWPLRLTRPRARWPSPGPIRTSRCSRRSTAWTRSDANSAPTARRSRRGSGRSALVNPLPPPARTGHHDEGVLRRGGAPPRRWDPNEHVSTTNQDTQTLRRSIDRETSFERMPNGVLPGRWAVQAKVIAPPGTDCGQPQDRAAPLPCASSARPAAAMRGVKRPPAPRPSHQAPAAPRLSGPRARKR
jgi:hypothetical protein